MKFLILLFPSSLKWTLVYCLLNAGDNLIFAFNISRPLSLLLSCWVGMYKSVQEWRVLLRITNIYWCIVISSFSLISSFVKYTNNLCSVIHQYEMFHTGCEFALLVMLYVLDNQTIFISNIFANDSLHPSHHSNCALDNFWL